MTKKQKRALSQILASAALLIVMQLLGAAVFDRLFGAFGRWVRLAIYLVDYWIIGGDILKKAWKGIRNRQMFDECLLMAIATIGVTIPSFVIASMLIYVFSFKLNVLPTFGLDSWKSYILPVIAMGGYSVSYLARLMRSSLLDVMGQDYMRTARAKGVSSVKILFKHALRNAILPVITYVGPMLAGLMTGSFVVEKIFSIPGLGRDFVSAITNRDYMMIMGTTILLATLVIVANVVVDILYKIIDPRIKLQ